MTRISGDAYHNYTHDRLSEVPFIKSGDRLYFDDDSRATIESIYTNDFVIVFYEIDWDGDEWTDHFAADEFLHDVDTLVRDGQEIPLDWER